MNLSTLTDDALFGRVEALARTERFTLVDLLLHLGELDARPACQNKGYSSSFAYLTRHLGYSESDAVRRVRTARAARKYPSILRLVSQGDLNLVGVSMIEPLLTPANHEALIRKACRRSTREIERLVAEISPPAAEPRDRIRALPPPPAALPPIPSPVVPTSAAAPVAEQAPESGDTVTAAFVEPTLFPDSATHAPASASAEPAPALKRRYAFTFTVSEEVNGWYEQARDLLRHRFPAGGMEEVIGDALRRLVEAELSDRRATRPRNTAESRPDQPSTTRYIPKWIEDLVWRRDGGRCAYLAQDGHRCGETAWLELDHIVPWAKGGRSDDPENIRLLCRAHNQSEAARLFGEYGAGGNCYTESTQ